MTNKRWHELNRERGLLIDRNIAGILSPTESVRLEELTALADCEINRRWPRPTEALERLERLLDPEATP